jgi:hypothetical protein
VLFITIKSKVMQENKKIFTVALAAVIMAMMVLAGCAKDDTVIIDNSPAITKEVSFSRDLVPLFNKSCAISGCHVTGGVAPNLEANKAYNSLNTDLINTGSPENSELYKILTGKQTPAMPMGGASNPGNINAYVLAWIKQGAHNN